MTSPIQESERAARIESWWLNSGSWEEIPYQALKRHFDEVTDLWNTD